MAQPQRTYFKKASWKLEPTPKRLQDDKDVAAATLRSIAR